MMFLTILTVIAIIAVGRHLRVQWSDTPSRLPCYDLLR